MPGTCSHEFFWPLRAADGNYYQVCRLCGVQYAYDWDNMRRMRGGPQPSQTSSPKTSSFQTPSPQAELRAPLKPSPPLNLLVELDPAYRVFFRNLMDTLRPAPESVTGIPNVPFWREIFLNSDLPWLRFGESMVCHMVALAILMVVSQTWTSPNFPRRRSMFENSHITYYKPTGTFPALRGNPSRPRPAFAKKTDPGRRGSLRVTPERARQASVNAPDLKLNAGPRPNIVGSNSVAPMMPLASTGLSRLTVPAAPASVVAPPSEVNQAEVNQAEVNQASSRRPGLGSPAGSAVAPAPEAGVVSSKRAITVPGAAVIGPPPTVQASSGRVGSMNMGPSAVVAPAPRLPVEAQRSSLLGAGGQAGLGSAIGLAVPPAPLAESAGRLSAGRLSPGNGSEGHAGSLSGSLQVVPPPPSVQGVGDTAGGGRLSGLSGSGSQVVPPAPSLESAGNSGGGRGAGGLSNNGVQGVAPAPSLGGGGTSDHGGRQMAMNSAPALAPAAPPITDTASKRAAERRSEPATEEMPLRLIGMAMALPTSSYFSNYEVFIAERTLSKGLAQLIKLVYVSLPYQRRLSEYGVDNAKVVKLRVSRDRSCDESLMQMTWPEADPHPDVHNVADSPALSAEDRKNMLPCYRTTADDYRKAMSRR